MTVDTLQEQRKIGREALQRASEVLGIPPQEIVSAIEYISKGTTIPVDWLLSRWVRGQFDPRENADEKRFYVRAIDTLNRFHILKGNDANVNKYPTWDYLVSMVNKNIDRIPKHALAGLTQVPEQISKAKAAAMTGPKYVLVYAESYEISKYWSTRPCWERRNQQAWSPEFPKYLPQGSVSPRASLWCIMSKKWYKAHAEIGPIFFLLKYEPKMIEPNIVQDPKKVLQAIKEGTYKGEIPAWVNNKTARFRVCKWFKDGKLAQDEKPYTAVMTFGFNAEHNYIELFDVYDLHPTVANYLEWSDGNARELFSFIKTEVERYSKEYGFKTGHVLSVFDSYDATDEQEKIILTWKKYLSDRGEFGPVNKLHFIFPQLVSTGLVESANRLYILDKYFRETKEKESEDDWYIRNVLFDSLSIPITKITPELDKELRLVVKNQPIDKSYIAKVMHYRVLKELSNLLYSLRLSDMIYSSKKLRKPVPGLDKSGRDILLEFAEKEEARSISAIDELKIWKAVIDRGLKLLGARWVFKEEVIPETDEEKRHREEQRRPYYPKKKTWIEIEGATPKEIADVLTSEDVYYAIYPEKEREYIQAARKQSLLFGEYTVPEPEFAELATYTGEPGDIPSLVKRLRKEKEEEEEPQKRAKMPGQKTLAGMESFVNMVSRALVESVSERNSKHNTLVEFSTPERQLAIRWARGDIRNPGPNRFPLWFTETEAYYVFDKIAEIDRDALEAKVLSPNRVSEYAGRNIRCVQEALRCTHYKVTVVDRL